VDREKRRFITDIDSLKSLRRPPEGRHPGPPESTNQEVQYIKKLIDDQTPVTVRLNDNQEVQGVIEYYDRSFIRLTREGAPNLFIFKDKIKYLYETPAQNRQNKKDPASTDQDGH